MYNTDYNRELKPNINSMKNVVRRIESFFEIIILSIMFFLVWRANYRALSHRFSHNGKYLLIVVYFLLSVIIFSLCEALKFGRRKLSEIIPAQFIALFLTNFITYFQISLIANKLLPVGPMFLLLVIDFTISSILSYAYTLTYHKIFAPSKILMVYGSKKAMMLKFKMDTRADKYDIAKSMSYELGFEAITAEIPNYDAVIINDVPAEIRNDILKFCYQKNVSTYLVPKITDVIIRGSEEINLFDTPLLYVNCHGLSPDQKLFKRILDIVLCLVAMIVAGPIMLVVALCIKIEDGGPVFYKQKRVTEGGKVFEILKFRSMIVDAEKDGYNLNLRATDKDPRITKVGNIIRACRIDELPQILNILKGDMSIVGPRPERVENVEAYTEEIPEFVYRTKVKGGLTGYAQIYGKYNTSPYDKLRLDLLYIENYSFLLDLKLICMTVQILLKKESTEGFEKDNEEGIS